MRVKLIDIDSKIPNLALMKISAWHKARGDDVGFNTPKPDKVYISCIYSKNKNLAHEVASGLLQKSAVVDMGGSGVDLQKTLPGGVELLKPDYDLYPSTYSQGYTSRGCIRKCGFCVVPQKEGTIKTVQQPWEFHDDQFKSCMLMDNNLFATPHEWQCKVFGWFYYHGIKMMDHGFDIRLLNEERAGWLKDIKHQGPIHFAWDNMSDEPAVVSGIELLKDTGFNLKHKITIYVLVGFNTTFEEDVYRCTRLRALGVQTYVMRYTDEQRLTTKNLQLNGLARWANSPWIYWKTPFSEYTRKGQGRKNAKPLL
jgi:hypothetical protein